ncbi:MAG: 2-C-methyl-D-erythritol 4-phosphate cytidylyltransferase [Planctomycetes bacterium]|nr:2-C-methyl-D-erythritol 4-phosphate cytidylyltransferase [Planctomycetota bacterium]
MSKNVAAIICAAGASSRFGGKKKKPFVNVAGRAAFLRSVELFNEREDVKQVLLAISEEDEEMVEISWGANLQFFGVKVCIGGAERFETVSKALELVKDDIDIVAVHDAVRCCVTAQWIDECLKKAFETGAAMLACPVVATIKDVKDGLIVGTVDRAGLYEAQTPQIFSAELLRKAYSNIDKLDKSKISDDSQLVEMMGHKVAIVETDSSNIKITRPCDAVIATAIIKERQKQVKPKGYKSPFNEDIW